MLKKVIILAPPLHHNGSLHHYTQSLHDAFLRQGVESHIFGAEGPIDPREFLNKLLNETPDCTVSFNGLLPDEQGRFLCDQVKVPHVGILLETPNHYFPMVKSSHSILCCDDRYFCHFFKSMPFENVLFFPNATDKEIHYSRNQERDIDVGIFATYVDFEELRKDWHARYSMPVANILDAAAEITLSDQKTSYIEAFIQAMDNPLLSKDIDANSLPMKEILDYLENYVRGKDRFELANSIKDAKLHIYGSSSSKATWKDSPLHNHNNIIFHEVVDYEEVKELMKRTKIVLNSSITHKNGGHERIFLGLACGALVITNENIYLNEHFTDNLDISFYRHKKWNEVNDKVNDFLANEDKRAEIAAAGRKIVMEHHTWDNRVNMLRHLLPAILEKLPRRVVPTDHNH